MMECTIDLASGRAGATTKDHASMNHTLMRRALAALAIVPVAVAAAGCSTSTTSKASAADKAPAKADATTQVTVGDMYIHPSDASVKAGNVDFAVTNDGKVVHELVVLKTDAAPDSLHVGDNGRISEDASVGEVGDIEAGSTKHNVIRLEPGKYVLVCNIKGHYMAGMSAPLTVT